ncbi:MAG: CHASE3 domain-containing protein, partial [Candidatus Aquirickettsiella gammari]
MTELLSMNLSTNFKRRTLVAFEICMVLLLLSGIFAWNNARLSSVSIQGAEQAHQLTRALENLRSNLDKAENRQWAFFLTQEPSLIKQRDVILQEITQGRENLQALVKAKASMRADIDNIDSIVEQRINTLIDSEKTFSAAGFGAAAPKFNKGIELATDIRRLVLGLERQIQDDLHQQQSDELARLTQIALIIISLLTLTALLSAWIQRSIHQRLVEEYSLHEQKLPLLKNGALQDAIFNSINFSSIATDAQGVIQIFNVGAER